MHLFRHAGGKIFLDSKPGQYEIVRRVLGHKSLNTTTSIYTGAETRSAGQLFAQVINDRRLDLQAELKTKHGKRKARSIATVKRATIDAPTSKRKAPMHWTQKQGGQS